MLAVVHIGAPACGMNAAVRSFVRNCIYRGDTVFGIHDGIDGLIEGNVSYSFCFTSRTFSSSYYFFLNSIFLNWFM